MSELPAWIKEALAQQRQKQLWREPRVLAAPQARFMNLKQQRYLSFCSNDYLGLANHPKLIEAMASAATKYGVGSGSSHLVSGHLDIHEALESAIASWLGVERVLLFSTGYMANLAVISALGGKQCPILQDKLNHASLIDGAQLSQASWRRYLHSDMNSAATMMGRYAEPGLLVTDGVFSMDGDVPPLNAWLALANKNGWMTMVDDAHGLGCIGADGKGTLALFGRKATDVTALVGTFGKAFGTAGAFVACSQVVAEYLTQFARPYIYTTAMSPAIAATTLASLQLIRGEEGVARRDSLSSNIAYFKQKMASIGVNLMASSTAIQPILVGESGAAMALSQRLNDTGILCTAIRPPTVPNGQARLRITLTADHTFDDIDLLTVSLSKALQETVGDIE